MFGAPCRTRLARLALLADQANQGIKDGIMRCLGKGDCANRITRAICQWYGQDSKIPGNGLRANEGFGQKGYQATLGSE